MGLVVFRSTAMQVKGVQVFFVGYIWSWGCFFPSVISLFVVGCLVSGSSFGPLCFGKFKYILF